MEKKTIGALIAALRKANGMTQKDLAERLNLSDKTISRWEREEGMPDLSVIPVLAEIFDISCDELLRGERKPPQERAEMPFGSDTTQRGEKQIKQLLRTSRFRFQTQTYIAIGISLMGMIVAMICNLAFLKARLGFFCGALFFCASIICQAILINRAFLSVADVELYDSERSAFYANVIHLAEKSFAVAVGCLGFTLPLLSVDAYAGLDAGGMVVAGVIGAGVCLLLYALGCFLLHPVLLRKGILSLTETEAVRYHHNRRLKKISMGIWCGCMIITALIHISMTSIWGPGSIMEGRVFEDYKSFVAFMEEDMPDPWAANAQAEEALRYEITAYYDAFGNEITEEEALHRTLEDENGNVVCEYTDRNQSVVSVRYTPQNGSALPITVFTYDDLQQAEQKAAVRHVIFIAVYCVETVAVLLFYLKKRNKKA